MNSATIYRTSYAAITVSTVLVREGGVRYYETSLVMGGRVSDGRRTSRKDAAGREHDLACDFVRYPSMRDARSVRVEFWTKALADLEVL